MLNISILWEELRNLSELREFIELPEFRIQSKCYNTEASRDLHWRMETKRAPVGADNHSPFTIPMEIVSFNCWTWLLEADVVETGKACPVDILQMLQISNKD